MFPAKLCGVFGATTQVVGADVVGDPEVVVGEPVVGVMGEPVVGEHVFGASIVHSGQSSKVIPGHHFVNSVVKTFMNGP